MQRNTNFTFYLWYEIVKRAWDLITIKKKKTEKKEMKNRGIEENVFKNESNTTENKMYFV